MHSLSEKATIVRLLSTYPRGKEKKPSEIDPNLWKDQEFIEMALTKRFDYYQFVDEELRSNREWINNIILNLTYTSVLDTIVKHSPESLRDDTAWMKRMIKLNNSSFNYASTRLLGDKEFVLYALKCGVWYNVFAKLSEELKKNVEIATHIVKKSANELKDILVYHTSRDFLLTALSAQDFAFQYIPSAFATDRYLIKDALQHQPGGYRFISENLKKDREIALLCCTLDGENYEYIPKEFQKDIAFTRASLPIRNSWTYRDLSFPSCNDEDVLWLHKLSDGAYCHDIPSHLWENRSFLLRALAFGNKNSNKPLNVPLLDDPTFVRDLILLKRDAMNSLTLSSSLTDNKTLCYFLAKHAPDQYKHFSDRLKKDPEILRRFIKYKERNGLKEVPEELRSDKNIVLDFVKKDGGNLQYAPLFQDDLEIAQAAVQSSPTSFRYASERLRDNEAFAFFALSKGGSYNLEQASVRLRSNKEFILRLYETKPDIAIIRHLCGDLPNDKSLILTLMPRKDEVEYLSDAMKNDPDVVIAAAKVSGYSLHKYLAHMVTDEVCHIMLACGGSW